jgi:hypothetical protein
MPRKGQYRHIFKEGDLINGHWYVGEAASNGRRKVRFLCKFCKEESTAELTTLKSGATKSCGCLKLRSGNESTIGTLLITT